MLADWLSAVNLAARFRHAKSPAASSSVEATPPTIWVPAEDPRVRATFERVAKELSAGGGLVYRYVDGDDGLPGSEGTFVMCSFWLVGNLALAGETERARELFETLLGYTNDLGLLSEEIDPATGELLGNFPQAFSHVGLIGAARNLREAESRT